MDRKGSTGEESRRPLTQLGRRHSPGPLPPYVLERSGSLYTASRSSSQCETLPENAILDTPPGHVSGGPMGNREVLLQGFNWECSHRRDPAWYSVLASRAHEMKDAGITAVWLPPPSASVSTEGYLPGEYECLNSSYGSEKDLRRCIKVLHANGIKAVADVVLNHRCAGKQDSKGRWNQYTGRYAWDAGCICSGDEQYGGTGQPKEGSCFGAAPNVDHSNERVRKDIKQWLSWLRSEIGFDGWRFDFVKGYSGRHVMEYIEGSSPVVVVGEFWNDCVYTNSKLEYNQDAHRQKIIDWCDATGGTAAAFDFTTKAVLQEAVASKEYWRLQDSHGRPPGVLGWWPSRAVTFIDNHDTGSTQAHWPFPAQFLHQGYAYILTHPGTPCLFLDHLWTDGMLKPSLWRRLRSLLQVHAKQGGMTLSSGSMLQPLRTGIFDLLKLRRRLEIHADSQVEIREANEEVYAATVDDKLAMKIGPGAWEPSKAGINVGQKAWLLAVNGPGFMVWEAHF
ncbi:g11459 [Coccomyxa viridis]|uniref:Alpha-amylase n=1 Tax=Coccomyxa viridis TaxID=1274662 RepID=A0ABP1G814_9CHLO